MFFSSYSLEFLFIDSLYSELCDLLLMIITYGKNDWKVKVPAAMNEEIFPRSLLLKILFDLKIKQHGKFRSIKRSYKDQ